MTNKAFDLTQYIASAVARLSVKKGRIMIYRHVCPNGQELWHYTNGDIETRKAGELLEIINIGESITEAYIARKYAYEVEYTADGYRRDKKSKNKACAEPAGLPNDKAEDNLDITDEELEELMQTEDKVA